MDQSRCGVSRRKFIEWAAASFAGAVVGAHPSEVECNAGRAPKVMTVAGEVSAAELGVVLPHEHVMVDFVGADKVSKDRYDRDEVFRATLPHLKSAHALGVKTLVECTPAYLGRDPLLLKRLSKASGLQILTNTGLYGAAQDKFLPGSAFAESAEIMAKRWTSEWKAGIEGSGVRPGFIKIGVDPKPSDVDMKLLRAAALTHLASGLVIASHTGPGEAAEKQIEAIKAAGVHPSAFIWVHAQAEPDSSHHVWAAREGAWVEFDGVAPDTVDRHAQLVAAMDREGLLDHVLVSHDAGWYSVGDPAGGAFRPFDTLIVSLLPALRKLGFDGDRIRRLTQANPRQAFAIRVRRAAARPG